MEKQAIDKKIKKAVLIIQWDVEDDGYRDTLPTFKRIELNDNYDVSSDLDYYTDKYGKGIRQQGDMMCAVPKREIVISDETPGEELGTLEETPKEVLEYDVRKN